MWLCFHYLNAWGVRSWILRGLCAQNCQPGFYLTTEKSWGPYKCLQRYIICLPLNPHHLLLPFDSSHICPHPCSLCFQIPALQTGWPSCLQDPTLTVPFSGLFCSLLREKLLLLRFVFNCPCIQGRHLSNPIADLPTSTPGPLYNSFLVITLITTDIPNIIRLKIYLLIWFHWVLVATYRIFSSGMWNMYIVPWPGIEPGPLALGKQSLSQWTTRDVPIIRDISRALWDFSAHSLCVPHFLDYKETAFIQPPWPSLSSKGQTETIVN